MRNHFRTRRRNGHAPRPRPWAGGIALFMLWVAVSLLTHVRGAVVDRWVFARTNVTGSLVADLAGSLPGTIQGAFSWITDPEALALDGSQCYVKLAEPIDTTRLPRTNMTIEAWVAMRSSGYYPGIAGCIQDNGTYERGWWLGADGGKFGFALAADTTLTYLWAPTAYQLNHWYHVAATYDGATMRLFVNGAPVAASTAERGNINYAPAPAVLGAYKDDNEIHPMDGYLREVALHDTALAAAQVAALYNAQKDLFHDVVTPTNTPALTVALGPYVRFTALSNAVVSWETATPQPSILEYGSASPPSNRLLASTNLTLRHSVELAGLAPRSLYYYRLVTLTNGGEGFTDVVSFETDFNYSPQTVAADANPFPDAEQAGKLAQAILDQTGVVKGYALDYGASDGALAYELARRSDLNVMVVSPDPQRVDQIRRKLQAAGVYGTRVTALAAPLDQLPYTRDWFNLVVSSGLVASGGKVPGTAAEAWRVLRPDGGIALLGLPRGVEGSLTTWNALNRWAETGIPAAEAAIVSDPNRSLMLTRARKAGAGEWTHNYGDPGQTASSGDQRVQARSMRVQWFGDPGPRGFTDRQARNPTPLMAGGTLYSQGNDRIAAQDAYNGRLLWSLEVPGLRRVNMPRDGGNWCADDMSLFVALRQKLLRFSRRDGSLLASYDTATTGAAGAHEWGCVAAIEDRVYGTSIKPGAFYTKWDGTWDYWYDSTTSLAEIAKLVSDDLFCLAKSNGAPLWKHTNTAIVNTSLAFGGGRVYFVESRNPAMLSYGSGRADTQALWTNLFLVSLDAATGARLWERALTEVAVTPYPIVFYLSYADEKLVITDSTTRYFIYGYSAKDGSALWSKSHAWRRNHHGSHMYHPVIAGKNVIVEPYVYDLDTGAVVRSDLPERGGCSTMSAAANCVHYINWDYSKGAPYFWDLATNERRQMAGTRASCWLSMISGGGMVTILPGSAGCACRFPIQSTLAWGAP